MALAAAVAHHPIYQDARMQVRAMRQIFMNPAEYIQNYIPIMSDAFAASVQQSFSQRLVNFCIEFQTMAGLIQAAQAAGVAHYNPNFLARLAAANARVGVLTANALVFTLNIEELYQLSQTFSDPYNMGGTYEEVAYRGVFTILLTALLAAFAIEWRKRSSTTPSGGSGSPGGASTGTSTSTTGSPAGGLTATIISGDKQSVARSGLDVPGGSATFAPLQVKLVNASGQPAAGISVGFAKGSGPSAMAVQLEPAGAQATTIVSDAQGVATLNHMGGRSVRCYYAQGPFTIVASPAGGNQVTFTLTVADSPPPPPPQTGGTLSLVSGDGQRLPRTMTSSGIPMASFAPMVARLVGNGGAPLPGQQVTWSSPIHPAGMAVQMEPSGASPCIVVSDANGVVTLSKMGGRSVSCYYADGGFTVKATYGNSSVTFSGTVG